MKKKFFKIDEDQLQTNRIKSIEKDGQEPVSRKKALIIVSSIAILAVTALLVAVTLFYTKPGSFLSPGNGDTPAGKEKLFDNDNKTPILESENIHIKRGKDSYQKKYYTDAITEFNEVLESDAGDQDKAIALAYLGMISDDRGEYERAIEFYSRALVYDKSNPEILKYLAVSYRHTKQYDKALENLKTALSLHPNDVDIRILMGNIYFETGRYDEAIEQYRAVLEVSPDNAKVMYNIASALMKKGDEFSAVEYFKKAGATDRIGDIAHQAYSRLGVIYIDRKDFALAEQYLKQAVSIRPTDPVNHYNLGIAYLRQDKKDPALEEFIRAESLSSGDNTMLENLGNVYLDMNQFDRSLKAFEKLLETNKRNIKILSKIGEIYYQKGELDRAYEVYKKITMLEPVTENARVAYLNMGNILDDAQRFDEAIEAYKKALSINPKDDAAHYNLGLTYRNAQKPELAIQSWKEASRLNPENPRARLAIADYYYEYKFYDLAEKEYQDILLRWPGLQEAHFKMGTIYYKRNQLPYALKAFQRTVEINENNELSRKAYINMAIINSELTDTEDSINQSLQMVQKALLIKPSDAEALLAFGVLYTKKEMTDRAIESFYQAIKNSSDNALIARAYNNIGKCYYKKKEYRKALQAFTRGIEEDPVNEEIRMNRKAATQAYERELSLDR